MVPSAQAAMVQFPLVDFTGDDMEWVVKLSDGTDSDTAGYLQIDFSINSTGAAGTTGDITGLFLGFNDSVTQGQIDSIVDLAPPQTAAGPAVTWFGDDVTAVFEGASAGCNNLNGGDNPKPSSFIDIGFTLGVCGSSGGDLTSSTVYLQGITLAQINAVGGRAQSVGPAPNGGGGSSKLFLGTIPPPPGPDDEVPEPATVTLMGAGLLGLMYFRRRKNS